MPCRFVYNPDVPLWRGWLCAAMFTVLPFLATLCEWHGQFLAFVLGWKLRCTLAAMVCRKALALSAAARQVRLE